MEREEDSDEEYVPSCKPQDYISPEGVTYEIIENCSGKGSDKLFSSVGYSYTVRSVTATGEKTWLCTKRTKKSYCRARLIERGSSDIECVGDHLHPPDPHEYISALISATIKRAVASNPECSVGPIVKRIRNKLLPEELSEVPHLAYDRLHHLASRHKRKLITGRSTGMPNGGDSETILEPIDNGDEYCPDAVGATCTVVSKPKRPKLQKSKDREQKSFRQKNYRTGITYSSRPRGLQVFASNNSIQLDADDMFFHSISAVVKDLPKLSKSALKLEILKLVNTATQNEGKKLEQAATATTTATAMSEHW